VYNCVALFYSYDDVALLLDALIGSNIYPLKAILRTGFAESVFFRILNYVLLGKKNPICF